MLHIGLENIWRSFPPSEKIFGGGPRSENVFGGGPLPRRKVSTVGPGLGEVSAAVRPGLTPLHHRGFPHSAARARATALPLPAGPAPMFPSAALPRVPSLPPRPALTLRGPALESPYTLHAKSRHQREFAKPTANQYS